METNERHNDTNLMEVFTMNTTVMARFEQASAILGISSKELKSVFVPEEFHNDENLLSRLIPKNHINVDELKRDMKRELGKSIIKIQAAICVLQGDIDSEFEKRKSSIDLLIESDKPITQWSDGDILTHYMDSYRTDLQFELIKRSKGRPFIILYNDDESIDVLSTLRMLKKARKEETPIIIADNHGNDIHVYRVEEYHLPNRMRIISPLRAPTLLVDGVCPETGVDYNGTSPGMMTFLRVIAESQGYLKKAIVEEIETAVHRNDAKMLKVMFPDEYAEYEKKASRPELLPKRTMIESIKSVRMARSLGNLDFLNDSNQLMMED